MKKIIIAVIALFSIGFANAQEGAFKIGVHAGYPQGSFEDAYYLNLGVDLAYIWHFSNQLEAGLTSGYTTYLGKSFISGSVQYTIPNDSYIPIAATGQYNFAESWFLGADLGYAIYSGSRASRGGLYYQPKIGYRHNKVELYAGYKGISDMESNPASVNLCLNFKF